MKVKRLYFLVGVAFTFAAATANADEIVYWTGYANGQTTNQINQYDLTTGTNTVIDNTPASQGTPFGLVFSGNNLLYSDATFNQSSLRMLAPGQLGGVDTQITGGLPGQSGFLALDPASISTAAGFGSDPTVLLSENNSLVRIDLITGMVSPLVTFTQSFAEGTAYDGSKLFAVDGVATTWNVVQIDPLTGAIIKKSPTLHMNIAGLTYDPVSNLLYASEKGCLISFDPATLAGGACLAGLNDFVVGGVQADGNGNILIATANYLVTYNTATKTEKSSLLNPFIAVSDIAPLVGPGAPLASTPEPASMTLFASALLLGFGLLHRRLN
jgi:hypothetical protein